VPAPGLSQAGARELIELLAGRGSIKSTSWDLTPRSERHLIRS
jgi:hypothetical protein